MSDYGLERLKLGRRKMNHARYLVQAEGPSPDAEVKAREGLAVLRSAMNWLEGTKFFDEAHDTLDREGRYTRETFGCWLELDDKGYWITCPVTLAHNRVGMSFGGIVREAHCSICERDPYECEHITGENYDGQQCVRVITRVDLLEISLVERPAQPDARIERMSASVAELAELLGPQWKPGTPVSCDQCLTPCGGLHYPRLSH